MFLRTRMCFPDISHSSPTNERMNAIFMKGKDQDDGDDFWKGRAFCEIHTETLIKMDSVASVECKSKQSSVATVCHPIKRNDRIYYASTYSILFTNHSPETLHLPSKEDKIWFIFCIMHEGARGNLKNRIVSAMIDMKRILLPIQNWSNRGGLSSHAGPCLMHCFFLMFIYANRISNIK